MNLPRLVIRECPECAEPLDWLQSDGHAGLVVCKHCGGMFELGLVSEVAFKEAPRRPGPEGRDLRTLKRMEWARARRRNKRHRKPD